MVTTTHSWIRGFGAALLLIVCAAGADELGASLQLEGRMACRRGVAWLVACQDADDGSWQRFPGLTAQAALALASVAGDVPGVPAARRRALAYVRRSVVGVSAASLPAGEGSDALTVGSLAMALRLFLREGIAMPQEIKTRLHGIVAAEKIPVADAMVVLETLLLLQHPNVATAPAGVLTVNEPARLAEMLLVIIKGGGTVGSDASMPGAGAGGELLAARMVMGAAGTGAAARRRLQALVGDVNGASEMRFAELYWLARVLYAQGEVDRGEVAGWRRLLLTALLEKQRGDGGWGHQDDCLATRVAASAWALQTLALLLAAPLPGE